MAAQPYREKPSKLEGMETTIRVAVITGAGAGIGAGLARHASALGMTVVLADIDAEIKALEAEIQALLEEATE